MYKTASNIEIGKYIASAIKKDYNDNTREFCRRYLELQNEDPTDENKLINLTNRMAQIKKGSKGIQIADLAYFTEMFDVTCEEILSAGKYKIMNNNRYTNYNFAAAKDEKYWEKYINRDDKIILNTDEHGETVIDYAIEFKNYDLLKYLVNKNYIWFVNNNDKEYILSFNAGTKIERKPIYKIDDLDYKLKTNDKFRTDMIALAIENNDFEMLNNLHAREIPSLYAAYISSLDSMKEKFEEYYNEEMLLKIAAANGKMISYFAESYIINVEKGKEEFVFPFIGRLIDIMIKSRNQYVPYLVEKVLEHSKKQLKRLSEMITKAYLYHSRFCRYKQETFEYVTDYYFSFKESGIFTYTYDNMKMASNVIHISEHTKNPSVDSLIDELNEIYNDLKCKNMHRLILE